MADRDYAAEYRDRYARRGVPPLTSSLTLIFRTERDALRYRVLLQRWEQGVAMGLESEDLMFDLDRLFEGFEAEDG